MLNANFKIFYTKKPNELILIALSEENIKNLTLSLIELMTEIKIEGL